MTSTAPRAMAPEHLCERFASCVAAGDVEGIVGLYAADAVVSLPRGREAAGPDAIRAAFAAALAAGVDLGTDAGLDLTTRVVHVGSLAMTSTSDAEGTVRTQVARREPDGSWLWVRDGSRLRAVEAALPELPDVA
ncbi:MAG: nuclear transport factor 2 family protein [Terracoccus sp.]